MSTFILTANDACEISNLYNSYLVHANSSSISDFEKSFKIQDKIYNMMNGLGLSGNGLVRAIVRHVNENEISPSLKLISIDLED